MTPSESRLRAVPGLPLAAGAPGDGRDRAVALSRWKADALDGAGNLASRTRCWNAASGTGAWSCPCSTSPTSGTESTPPRRTPSGQPDGRRILSALPALQPWRWQRLLFAQRLPLGRHAPGVRAAACERCRARRPRDCLVAPSGTGKTSVAAHLVAGGALLLTDDVLAFESRDDGVIGYPGVRNIAIAAQTRRHVQLGRADSAA